MAAIRPSSLYNRFVRSSFAKKLEKIPGVEKVLTPRKELSLPSLSLGLTEQEYQQLRTPLAPGSSEETTPAPAGGDAFSEATRLGQVGLPQVGGEFSDGTRLAVSPDVRSEEVAPEATRRGNLAWKLGEEERPERYLANRAEAAEATRLKNPPSLPPATQPAELPPPPRPPVNEATAVAKEPKRGANSAAKPQPPAPPRPPEPPDLPPEPLDYTRRAPSPQNTDETRLRKGDDDEPNTP